MRAISCSSIRWGIATAGVALLLCAPLAFDGSGGKAARAGEDGDSSLLAGKPPVPAADDAAADEEEQPVSDLDLGHGAETPPVDQDIDSVNDGDRIGDDSDVANVDVSR